jgi:two-component system cell cycle sensor histidine kinase/response regulator CckA
MPTPPSMERPLSELQEELGRLQEEHQVLLELIPGALVCVLDNDLRYLHINGSSDLLGWQPAEIVGKTVGEVLRDRPAARAAYAAGLTGERQEFTYKSLNGERDFVVRVMPLSNAGEVYGVMSIHQDVTERDETVRRLAELNNEFESAFRYAAIGMSLVGLDGRWLKVNQSLCELVGFPEAELLEHTFQELTHPADLETDLAYAKELLAGEIDAYQMEKRYIRKDGSVVPVLLSVSLVRDENGAPARYVSQVQDRTNDERRRELERELAEQRRAEALNVLAGGVAHDFSNQLVAILGHTSMALGALPEGSAARLHVEEIESSARRVAELTEKMLAFSGNAWRQLVDVDLGEHALEASEILRTSHGDLNVRVSAAPDVPTVRADLAQLRRVTSSLVDNAVEALHARDGTVSFSTGVVHLTRATLDSYPVGAEASPGLFAFIEVGDDGCGMTQDVRGRMFEPFFTTKFQGRGLGLAAVEGMIRGHGGALAVHTAPGVGTRVRVLLPAAA